MSDEAIDILRDVFFADHKSKQALRILLGDMGYFSPVETDESQATKNYATRLVNMIGPEDSGLLADRIVDAIDTSYTMEFKSSKKENIK